MILRMASLLYPEAARIVREAVKDKSYRVYPLGQEAGAYLRRKRGSISPASYRSYESILDKFARAHPDLKIEDFEPPVGAQRLEEFMDTQWGDNAPGTYNTCLSIMRDFFKQCVLTGKLHGDPSLGISRHRKVEYHRTIFTPQQRLAIIAKGPDPEYLRRDRVCLRLLLDYGIRKGSLRTIQFKHFDANRRVLTIFAKGGKVRDLPVVEASLWDDVEKLQFDIEASPNFYLLHSRKLVFRKYDYDGNKEFKWFNYYDRQYSNRGTHEWWYGCLQRAGVTDVGQSAGERIHKARHTAGQRVLDATKGNLKATQMLLGHSSIKTTGDIYVDWDLNSLALTMVEVLGDE